MYLQKTFRQSPDKGTHLVVQGIAFAFDTEAIAIALVTLLLLKFHLQKKAGN